jgi:glycosyltransferase involved in cell wall biosynthesis
MNDLLIVFIIKDNIGILEDKKDQLLSIHHDVAPVLLVDDGSADGSAEIMADLEPANCIIHEESLGYGGVFISALTYARDNHYSSMMVFPVTARIDTEFIGQMYNRMITTSIISGNRMGSQETTSHFNDSFTHYRDFATRLNEITGYQLDDPFSPVKGFDLSIIQNFEFSEFSEGFFIQLLIQAAHHGLAISEFHCTVDDISLAKELDIHQNNTLYYGELLISEQYMYPVNRIH